MYDALKERAERAQSEYEKERAKLFRKGEKIYSAEEHRRREGALKQERARKLDAVIEEVRDLRASRNPSGYGNVKRGPGIRLRHLPDSTEPFEDSAHLLAIVCAQRGGPKVPRGGQFEEEGGNAFFIRCFGYGDDVVGTHGPVDLHQPHAVLVLQLLGSLVSLDGIPDVPDPLVGPVE